MHLNQVDRDRGEVGSHDAADNRDDQSAKGQNPDHHRGGDRPASLVPSSTVDRHRDAGEDQRRIGRKSHSERRRCRGAGQSHVVHAVSLRCERIHLAVGPDAAAVLRLRTEKAWAAGGINRLGL